MKIKRSSRRQFLLQGFATLGTTLTLHACKRDSTTVKAPTPPSPVVTTPPSPVVTTPPSPVVTTPPNPVVPTPPSPVVPTPPSLGASSQYLQFISIPPTQGQKFVGLIVCLHGNGSTPEFMTPLATGLNLPQYQFLFPRAPFSHPSVSGGKMWYDLTLENNKPKILNYNRLEESRQRLTNWLKSLEGSTSIPLSRTFLTGFSQGGAMTLDVGLTLPLAGLISFSGYLHPIPKITAKKSYPPVLIVHGRKDKTIPLSEAQRARNTLTALGVAVKYQEFDLGHEIQPEVVPLVREFIFNRR